MSLENENIDWERYSREGRGSPDFISLLQDLSSQDYQTRIKAADDLEDQLEYAYEKRRNRLPYDIVPVLIDLLGSGKLPDKLLVTDLLLFLVSYNHFPNLKEPYKAKALELRNCVCQGVETYKALLDEAELREDIVDLLEACDEQKLNSE